MLRSAPTRRRSSPKTRLLRMEPLETRCMLSHPAVAAVNVSGTAWDASFISFLESTSQGDGGYAIPVGSSAQLQTLTWTNINQIRIKFSEDVVLQASDLSVGGVNTTAYVFSNFSYDPNTFTAVWTLAAPLAKEKLFLDLDADGLDPVRSVATGEVLDGAWTDCQSYFNSGTGLGGDDFQFRINVLPGDTNASGGVALGDAVLAYYQIGQGVGDPGYNIRYDIDGSGLITNDDYLAIRYKIGGSLPSGNPVGMTNDAPSTCGIPNLNIAKGTADYVLTLTDFFDDAETAAENLTYSIVGNSNPSLFDDLDISSGELTFDFCQTVAGDAKITIRVVDGAGLLLDTDVSVHIGYAPIISNFYCIQEPGYYWTLTGIVTDFDGEVEGYQVQFGGVLANFHLSTTVRADGVFSLTVELIGVEMGTATAQTEDWDGFLSELALDWLIV